MKNPDTFWNVHPSLRVWESRGGLLLWWSTCTSEAPQTDLLGRFASGKPEVSRNRIQIDLDHSKNKLMMPTVPTPPMQLVPLRSLKRSTTRSDKLTSACKNLTVVGAKWIKYLYCEARRMQLPTPDVKLEHLWFGLSSSTISCSLVVCHAFQTKFLLSYSCCQCHAEDRFIC